MRRSIEKIIIIFIIILVGCFLLRISVLRHILKLILTAFLLAYSLRPLQIKLNKKGVNRKVSSMIIMIGIAGVISIVCLKCIPDVFKDGMSAHEEYDKFIMLIDGFYIKIESINKNETFKYIVDSIYLRFNRLAEQFFNASLDKVMHLGESLLSLAVIPVFVYYFLAEGDNIKTNVAFFVPVKRRLIARKIIADIDFVMQRYIISQFLLCALIAILTLIVLLVFKVEYAVVLSMINGIFNIIPYFGPIFGSVPIIFMAFLKSPQTGIWVTICLYVIQQLEGDIIAPKITGDSINMHPLTVILLLIIGSELAGAAGMILAIPVGVIIKIVYRDLNYFLF